MRTFVDSNVIITAAKNKDKAGRDALAFLSGTDREFLTSPFIELEVLPKPVRMGGREEVAFIEEFLGGCTVIRDLDGMVRLAYDEMVSHNVKLVDALHLAAAHLGGADELVTLEGHEQPMYRTRLVKVSLLAV